MPQGSLVQNIVVFIADHFTKTLGYTMEDIHLKLRAFFITLENVLCFIKYDISDFKGYLLTSSLYRVSFM